MTPAVEAAVARLDAAGTSSADRGAVWAELLADTSLHQHLAQVVATEREAAIAALQAAGRRAGPIRPLRDAVLAAMQERLSSGQGVAGRILGLPLPPPYRLAGGALLKAVTTKDGRAMDVLIARRELAITQRVADPIGGQVHVTLTWRTQDGSTEAATVPRQVAADGRSIVGALAGAGREGAPVHASNARAVVEFLAAQEEEAGTDLPTAVLARQLGWHWTPDGSPLGFLAGHTLLMPEGREVDVRDPSAYPPALLDQSPGLLSIASRVDRSGHLDDYLTAMEPALRHPGVGLCFCASIAPILLGPIRQAETAGILDIAADQGTGKTSALRIGAASVWGPSSGAGPMVELNATEAGLREHRMAVGGLPLLLNETQHLREQPELLAALVFQVFEGGDKLMSSGAGKGARPQSRSRSGAILTGNAAVIDMIESVEGSRTRVLTSQDPPWGEHSASTRALILDADGATREHYGLIGPAIVRQLLDHPGWWAQLRTRWTQAARRIAEHMGPRSERAADVLALYELAGSLAISALGVRGLDMPSVMQAAASAAMTSLGDVDEGRRALRMVVSWASSQAQRLDGRTTTPAGQGWIGRWDREPGASLILQQQPLCDFLRHRKLTPERVLKSWAGSGWLNREQGRRTVRRSVGGIMQPCYELTPEALAVAGATQIRTDAPT